MAESCITRKEATEEEDEGEEGQEAQAGASGYELGFRGSVSRISGTTSGPRDTPLQPL